MNNSNRTFVTNLRNKYQTQTNIRSNHQSRSYLTHRQPKIQRPKLINAGKICKNKDNKSKQLYISTKKKTISYTLDEDRRQRENRIPENYISKFKTIQNISRNNIKYVSKKDIESKQCIQNLERVQRNIRKILQNV